MKQFMLATLASTSLPASCRTASVDGDAVEGRVESALKANDFLGRLNVRAQHRDGRVTLTSNVDNAYQSCLATTIAKGVEDVKSVVNDIRVD